MTEYTNSGILFVNDRKKREGHPDYTGNFTDVTGKKWRLAAWKKQGRKGEFISVQASEFKETKKPPQDKARQDPLPGDMDDDLPW
ncbi:MAG: hypothetical protein ACR2RE_13040 [Geminicoccaceae bacterium]